MNDACFCDFDSEPPAFFSERYIKRAKRVHKCSECRKEIAKGAAYKRTTGSWNGEFNTFRWCAGCQAAHAFTQAHIPCVCWYFGGLWEEIISLVRQYESECPGIYFGLLRAYVEGRKKNVNDIDVARTERQSTDDF